MTSELSADVVVIGSGAAGLSAAVILHRWERVASRLVLGAAAFLQALFVAATAIAIG